MLECGHRIKANEVEMQHGRGIPGDIKHGRGVWETMSGDILYLPNQQPSYEDVVDAQKRGFDIVLGQDKNSHYIYWKEVPARPRQINTPGSYQQMPSGLSINFCDGCNGTCIVNGTDVDCTPGPKKIVHMERTK